LPSTNIRYSTNLENIIEISGSHVDSDESHFQDFKGRDSNKKMSKEKSMVRNNEEITDNDNKDEESS
jgi:hypothetical protein